MSETLLDTISDVATALLRLGLSNAAAAALLATVVAAITLPLRRRRPAVVHALWLLVLLKLVTPPLWSVPVQWPARADPRPPASVAPPAEFQAEPFVVVDLSAEHPEPPAPAETQPVDWFRLTGVAIIGMWLAGSAACVLLLVVRSIQFRRLLREATPAPAEVARQVRRVGRHLGVGRCPSTWFVPGAVCPMLYAAGRPRLLLPLGLWQRLDADQRDTLIAHELAHLRRRDHWVRFAEVAATALYWWFPVLWWARRELREAEEQCCDGWVVRSMPSAVRDYMTAILAAVDFVSVPETANPRFAPPAVPALASGMGEFRRLERRLWMIRANTSPHRLSRAGVLAVMACAAALPLAPTLAGEDQEGTATTEARDVVVTQIDPAGGAPVETTVEFDVSASEIHVDPNGGTNEATIHFAPDVQGLAVDGQIAITQPDDVATHRVVDARTGKVIEVRGQTLTITDGSDLNQARAAVEQARVNLKIAEARLKQLESEAKGRGKGDRAEKKEEKTSKLGVMTKPAPRTGTLKARIVENNGKGFELRADDVDPAAKRDPRQRMENLEQKLDLLMNELRELKQQEGKDREGSEPELKLRKF